jgi:hypothetical protein
MPLSMHWTVKLLSAYQMCTHSYRREQWTEGTKLVEESSTALKRCCASNITTGAAIGSVCKVIDADSY